MGWHRTPVVGRWVVSPKHLFADGFHRLGHLCLERLDRLLREDWARDLRRLDLAPRHLAGLETGPLHPFGDLLRRWRVPAMVGRLDERQDAPLGVVENCHVLVTSLPPFPAPSRRR